VKHVKVTAGCLC